MAVVPTRSDGDTIPASDINTLQDQIDDISAGYAVGDFKIYADMSGTSALPAEFQDCDGSVISDADSPYNGKRIYNINGGDVTETLTWTADAGGAYATVSADDLYALNEGDDVTGSGIAADTKITDISGTTVTISDVSASGSISTTFTNDGLAVYGGSGGSQGDQGQLLTGYVEHRGTFANVADRRISGVFSWDETNNYAGYSGAAGASSTLEFSSSNSPNARTSATTAGRTRSHARILKVAMRIK